MRVGTRERKAKGIVPEGGVVLVFRLGLFQLTYALVQCVRFRLRLRTRPRRSRTSAASTGAVAQGGAPSPTPSRHG